MNSDSELKEKVFSNKMISWATFLGTPVAGFHLISKNYKAFHNEKAARNSYYLGLLITVIIIVLIFTLPSNIIDIIPNQFIPLIYTTLVYIFVNNYQDDAIKKYYETGGQKGSGWFATGIGLGYMICFLFIVLGVSLFSPPYEGEVKNFGITNNQIYYDQEIPESDINEIGRALTTIQFFNNEYQMFVQLRSEDENTYRIIIPSDKEYWNDEQYLWEVDNLSDILKEFVPTKKFGVTLLYESLSGDEYKEIN
jgi:hypothetical protein